MTEALKERSMVLQKDMIAEHFARLERAPETGEPVVYTFVPGNLVELIRSFDALPVLPEINALQSGMSCPASTPVGLLDAAEIASNDSLPFRFPLDESTVDYDLFFGWFGVSNECPPNMPDCYNYSDLAFHAAEDYKRPAGTPVYAMADGRVSFSGRAGGYGWLIIIDHPQANLYSLYGHLSPSRWKQVSGTDVKRGDLIAYLGDPDENGGSTKSPLEPHLHFGIRAGQRDDYPGKGEWRWMAGWIRLCPQDIGWLQPSLVITSQENPVGGYPQPDVPFWVRWGLELLITSLYSICGTGILVGAIKKKWRLFLIFPGILVTAAGIVPASASWVPRSAANRRRRPRKRSKRTKHILPETVGLRENVP